MVVTPNDGFVEGAPVTTAAVTIADTAPVATVSLDDQTPSTNAVLTATATGSDVDAVTFTYVWKVNGTTVKTTPGSSNLTDTLDLSQAGNGDTGQTVSVTVTPNDGTLAGTPVADSAIVEATAPAAPTSVVVSVTPTSVELDWANNPPTDLAGYDVYRSGALEGPYVRLNNLLLTTSAFSDATAPIGSVMPPVMEARVLGPRISPGVARPCTASSAPMVENAMPASTARASSRRTPIAVRAKAAAVAASALAPTNHACIAPVQLTTWKPT